MYPNQQHSSIPPLPTYHSQPSSLNDMFKNMLGVMDPNSPSPANPFNFMNSPEFTSTVENMTRGLLQSLSSNIPNSPKDSKYKNINNSLFTHNNDNTNIKRTKNLVLELAVSLEDLYKGKNKKVAVKRKRVYEQSDGSFKIVEERKNLIITIPKGARNNHRVIFDGEADELPGFET